MHINDVGYSNTADFNSHNGFQMGTTLEEGLRLGTFHEFSKQRFFAAAENRYVHIRNGYRLHRYGNYLIISY